MGFFSKIAKSTTSALGLDKAVDFVGDKLLGGDAADAAKDAAGLQAAATREAIELQRETRDLAREDLAPFKDFGAGQLGSLGDILTSQGQMDYLQSNPLFQLGMDNLNTATMKSMAARGKLGSGDTLLSLQNNAYLAGMPLLQNQQNQLFNAANMGQSSAAGQANTALQTGNQLAALTQNHGDVLASGVVGAAGAKQAGINNLLNGAVRLGAAKLGGIGA